MNLSEARKKWLKAGKAYYQREANTIGNKKKRWPPFENLSQKDKDFFMARAQQTDQNFPAQ